MSEKFKKIDKEYCLTDDSVNVYKYRCLSSGLLLEEFQKNPIGYYLHGTDEHPREQGVLVRWEDFRRDGDKVFAKPCINLSHPRGQRTVDEINMGFLNAASVGKIIPLSASNAPNLKLDGQTRPTVTKWFPREISLVDIPGNFNALTTNLSDIEDKEITFEALADLAKQQDQNMSNNTLDAVKIYTALNLADNAQETEVLEAIQNLVDKADKSDKYKSDLDAKEIELADLKTEVVAGKVEDLIAKGKDEKKLTNELADKLKSDYATNPDGLESLIATLPAHLSLSDALKDGDKVPEKYVGKTWNDLYSSDELETVKSDYPDLFEKLKKEKYENLKD